MRDYSPPVEDMQFWLDRVLGCPQQWREQCRAVDLDTAVGALEQAGKSLQQHWAPLNRSGDEQGCTRHADGSVSTPEGFAAAYRTFADDGWFGINGSTDFGGHDLPLVLGVLLEEMMYSSNTALTLYAILSTSGAHCLENRASDELRQLYLPQIYSGRTTCTMCLTEPHSGSDLGTLNTRAEPQADGTWRLTGNKIFISSGQHDLADNIVHTVLARTPDAPAGTAGISMFVVPRTLPDGRDNTVHCTGVEHKMGIRGSATCAMSFEGAEGWMLGEPGEGLKIMFTIMNQARLSIGVQGVGNAEMSHQLALRYAAERVQGRALLDGTETILGHPDIQRMLLTQRAWIGAGRGLIALMGSLLDESHAAPDEARRNQAKRMTALLTPIAKGFVTDRALEACVLGQQVFGGHGYIREWGVEQLVRDVRISQIYEGTNGIQALDLIDRKLQRDGGSAMAEFLDIVRTAEGPHTEALRAEVERLERVNAFILEGAKGDDCLTASVACDYLELAGLAVFAWLWQRAAGASTGETQADRERRAAAGFYFARLLPRAESLERVILSGSAPLRETLSAS